MTVQTNTANRKELAKALAEELGTTAKYMGLPSYAYQVGDYTVNRDGSISGDDLEAIRPFLEEHGYIEVTPVAEPAAEADAETTEQEAPESTEEIQEPEAPADVEAPADEEVPETKPADEDSNAEPITSMEITIPAQDVTVAQLKNLTHMLFSRQTLINRMTQSEFLNIPECLIEALRDKEPETPEAFTQLLDACKADGLTGFDFRDGKVSMTFPFDEAQPTRWTAYANLLNRIFDAAMKAKRVFPDRVEPDAENEKYYAHVWLQRLGYHGANFKAERQILLGHMKGYCAFANSDKAQAHKDKYAALRRQEREMRTAQPADSEAPVTETAAGEEEAK